MTNSIITLTEAAAEHIKKMLAQNASGVGFRLSVKKTGCSGYAYVPEIIDNIKADDFHFLQNDLNVYIDPSCENFIKGLLIDYVADENNLGLKQKRLVFINPNEKNRCGCGESFTLE